tara:strand:+ start:26263 stop:27303 length:1041 start_codon:yes stop_codon:yes gene_type:complete
MSKIFVVSNDKFFFDKKNIHNSNKNTFTIINCFKKIKKIYLIARKSKNKLKFNNRINNVELINVFKLFQLLEQIKKNKTIIISLTPFNFLVSIILIISGVKKENLFLFLRSDGFQEYKIKFGKIGYFIYGLMYNFLKKNLSVLSCSKSLTGVTNPKLIYPSEITDRWLKNRKKQIKKISHNKTINLLYLGRFRKEKGYESLINLFKELEINASLTMIGNDFKYLKKVNYPKIKKIKIFGQISSTNELIGFFDKSDILILPSFIEAYPQVILESLSRLKPIVIFDEIKYLKKTFQFGLFNCQRNKTDFEKKIKIIVKNYKKIQMNILKKAIYSQKNFYDQMNKILVD